MQSEHKTPYKYIQQDSEIKKTKGFKEEYDKSLNLSCRADHKLKCQVTKKSLENNLPLQHQTQTKKNKLKRKSPYSKLFMQDCKTPKRIIKGIIVLLNC